MISITLPMRTVTESNAKGHWWDKAKRASDQRWATYCCVLPKRDHSSIVGMRVLLTRIGPKALDGDNLQSALKHVRDGVADALGIDDADPRVTWEYAQEKPPKTFDPNLVRGYGVRIEIRARDEAMPMLAGGDAMRIRRRVRV